MKLPLIIAPLLTLLAACGGGGGGNDNPVVAASVFAGNDQQIIEKSEFTIEAKGSPADGTFTWQRVSGPIIDGFPLDGALQTVTAPDIKADSELLLRVSYQTSDGQLVTDDLLIAIESNNQLPQIIVTQTAPETLPSDYKDIVTLSAAGSIDPDENGQINSYSWQQIAGPTLAVDSNSNATISFSHPLLDTNTLITWLITVVDDEGGESSFQYSHTLNKTSEVLIANAGDDQSVIELEKVTLDATDSETVTETFKCYWQQTAGTAVLDNQQQCITSFTAPATEAVNTHTFEVTVTDNKGRTDTDTVDIVVKSKPLGLLNDTGMSKCYNNTQEIACTSPDFPRQDASVGRDSVSGTHIKKSGEGDLAFDFTKLNQSNELYTGESGEVYSCLRDNVTGLIWEVKASVDDLTENAEKRLPTNHYTWYINSDSGIQVGSVSSPANSTCVSNSACDIQTYVNELNADDYCNGANWRVPTYSELMGLLDYSRQGSGSLLSEYFFPNQPEHEQFTFPRGVKLPYWTSQTAADGTSLTQAYIFDIANGNDIAYSKSDTAFVRLVRTSGE
ncbi:MAG: PKD domain-containing protein [Pseudoalteromonas prydzensis]|uniref:Lcl C-terminal domain-containing protein n=1 Tax=Pseudoalteromonas prydzensis TaxID=182141 RepID=UPI003F9BFA84